MFDTADYIKWSQSLYDDKKKDDIVRLWLTNHPGKNYIDAYNELEAKQKSLGDF